MNVARAGVTLVLSGIVLKTFGYLLGGSSKAEEEAYDIYKESRKNISKLHTFMPNHSIVKLTTGIVNSSGTSATASVAVEHPHPITATW